ncbi:EamA family transporter RarD [Chitinimonas sp. BJB300]|uniref:EamA family transporter RarD n=1 Tax=Chitinimonas sp. BJB300 TaxID=1559339 RepID=UPI000C0D7A93|nr:EamA family transporter RarD [Chitinimonas sp. BJB300]PHV10058.1 protein RarD [Chitinimonas sp. BJB300]TSJ87202.1 EamA family transporter RarD [Chitinimonas sp. BJB300]
MQTGILYACAAYFIWGLLPLYLKALKHVPALEILLHRMIWSLVFLAIILAVRKHWGWLKPALCNRKVVLRFIASAAVLSINWFIYIWAVNAGRVVDASLGYFINPLVNVMFGYLLLHERLRPAQWGAIAVAAAGVLWLTIQAGQLPWIGLMLAATFGTYGLLRKTAPLGALEGLSLETLLLTPFAMIWLGWLISQGQSGFVNGDAATHWLLIAAGPITAIPLLLFAAGARRIPMSLLGLLQYIGPTLQMGLGVFLWHEPFGSEKLVGFALIWSALVLYTLENLFNSRKLKQIAA